MANVTKISVALTPEMAATVGRAVESGDYASSSEVIREALREWKQKRAFDEEGRERLGRLWRDGLDSGPGRLGGMAEIKAAARRRLSDDPPRG